MRMTIQEEKQRLRRRIRAEMREVPESCFRMAGAEICRRVWESEYYRQAGTVFCFVSCGREPDTYPLLRKTLEDGKRLCVPLCGQEGSMEARQIHSLKQLAPGAYGIPEPPAELPVIPPQEIDLALIPCLAASRKGARLGKGGGFYDRFLAGYTGQAMLLCPERFFLADLPVEEHDIPIAQVVTDGVRPER
jgi:5-formyltetrahydrofolate cyclo-ligase